MEPRIHEYYQEQPECMKTIDKLNEEYLELQNNYDKLKKELEFYNSAFRYPHNSSVIYNLLRVTKNGEPMWIDRIKTYEHDLKQLDQCDTVKFLIENSNPRCER